jgi:foldase protein PrsA
MKAWSIGMLAVLAAALSAQEAAVVVNGEEVKNDEYYRRLEVLPGVGRNLGGRFVEAPPGFMALQRIIEERLLLQLAKQKNVAPTSADVQKELDRRTAENPKYLDALATLGIPRTDVEHQIRVMLAEFRLQTMGVTVTDQEVEQFYKANPRLFTTPKRYRLRVIAVRDEAAQKAVDADLQAGKPFADVARQRSEEVSKAQGGLIGELALEDLAEEPRRQVAALAPGQTTSWMKSSDVWTKMLLEEILPSRLQPLDAKLRDDLRRRLMLDRGKVRNDIDAMMKEMRAKAKVEVRRPQFVDPVRQYLGR